MQKAGLINKNNQTQMRNVSQFVNERIIDFFEVNHPEDCRAIEEKLLLEDIKRLQKERDKVEDSIRYVADKLRELRGKSGELV